VNVNAALDRMARVEVGLAGRRQPTFRVCVLAGFALAVAVGAALTAASGLSLAVTGALAVICAVTFVVQTLARKVVTGEERLIYYHHEIACVAAAACALWLLGEPVLSYLDVTIVGIGVCLAAGRLGCFAAGCCHGRPCGVGVRYGHDHVAHGLAPDWLGIRLFPVQLVEAVAAAAIVTVCGGAMLAGAAPGTAFAFYVVAYGAVRFGLEFARGDAGRGAFAGMTQPQWLSLACAIALLALGASSTVPVGPLHVVLTAALVALALSLLVRAGHTVLADTRREPSCHS
jgi:prolipoprotein diacylglyceryltransferase